MKIKYKNSANIEEKLICDCGGDEFELYRSDENGDAFICADCEDRTSYFTDYTIITPLRPRQADETILQDIE